jgi:RNA 3'-phosphate cyclase
MIEIDGSIGGGQILRTAVGLSALTLKPFRMINIRQNRPKPGLKAQHLAGVKVSGEMCKAKIRGMKIGSTNLEFIPSSHDFSDKEVDIGTAGSVQLLLQTITPAMIFSDKPVTLKIKGGTAGLGAPTAEYTKFVIFPMLGKLGFSPPRMEILKQGFYPRGGGVVQVKFFPTTQLKSVRLVECGEVINIRGFSIAGNLPLSVAERQSKTIKKVLSDNGFNAEIESSNVQTFSAGTSATIFAECQNTILGADEIGKIGKRAERVGKDTAKSLVSSIKSGKAFDKCMSDQIIPFIALAKGRSEITVEDFTEHVKTNMLVTEKILDVEFEIDEIDKKITVEGISYKI